MTKEAKKEYMKKYRKENHDRILAHHRKWNAENHDQKIEQNHKWRKNNPDYEKEYMERKHYLWRAWHAMFTRCYNTNVKECKLYYAPRRIAVCKQWFDYDKFKAWCLARGWKRGMVIHRPNVEGDYKPSNVVFLSDPSEHAKIHWEMRKGGTIE